MKKKFMLFFAIIIFSTSFAACDNQQSFKETTNEFYSFETTTDLYSLWRNNFYGKMELSSDYVSQGKSSAKVVIDFPSMGRNNLTLLATECMPRLTIEVDNFNKSIDNLSKYAGIRGDVYNANDREMTLVFYLSNDKETITARHFKLPPNSWTYALLPTGAIDAETLSLAKYIEIGFMGNELFEGDTIFYVDNIHLFGKQEDTILKEKTFKQNEILSFSSYSDIERVSPFWVDKIPYTAVAFNADSKYSKTDGGSLHLSILPIAEGKDLLSNTVGDNGRVGFELKSDFLSTIDFKVLHFSSNPAIGIDVFNSSNKERIVYLDVIDSKNQLLRVSKTVGANEWSELILVGLSTSKISDIKSIRLTSDLFSVIGSADLYFSNLRMVP